MKKYILDCSDIKTEDDFWDAYVSNIEIDGEEFFGRNLDALWDALHAGGPGTPRDRCCFISVRKTESLKSINKGNFYDHLRQIAYDLGTDPNSHMKFRVN